MSFHVMMAHFLLALNNVPLSECTIHLLNLGLAPTDHCLAVINKAAVTIHVQVFGWT